MKKCSGLWIGMVLFFLVFVGMKSDAFATKDSLVVGLVAEPVSFDAPQVSDANTILVLKRIFEGLVDVKLGTYELEPSLAQSWDISNDGKTYTFYLRKNVLFHDGTPFNAEAVKYSIERQINPDHPQHKPGVYPYAKGFLGNVNSIDVVNESTVRFTLKSPLAPFLQYLTHSSLRIMSPSSLKKWGKDVAVNPAGTGPFKLKSREPGVRVVFERNEQYWGGAPKIKNLIYVPIIEAQARLSAIKTGEIDLTRDVPPDSFEMLRKDPKIDVLEAPSAGVWFVALNTQKSNPPFNNKLVRQAMNYAVNKEAIVRDILKGTAVVSYSPLSPVYGKYHLKDAKKYPYDPARAKELLKQAGYPNGFECKFIIPESGSGMQAPVEMATVIQADLAAVGIKAKIQTYEFGAWLKELREGHDMTEMSWSPSIGDPDHMVYMLLHSDRFPPGYNTGLYKNEKVDDLLYKARTTADEEKRIKFYLEAQQIIVEDAPWIFVDHGKQTVVKNKRVKNFILTPNFDFEFKNVYLE